MVVVGVALTFDGLAYLVFGELEGARAHDVLLVPMHVLVEFLHGINVGIRIGQGRQEREGCKFEFEDHRLIVRRGNGVDHYEVAFARAGNAGLRVDDLVPTRRDVLRRKRGAVVEFHALSDLEGIGQPIVGWLGYFGAQVAGEIAG